ncbi:hypothetical protein P3X46_028405 [Hevea brasiliensis]|uniref:Retrotransposon gag domain-containing protein n=1 Tax=Hevea brasiliensis TaxID=3981 RepID=A0ABQ9KP00_HEVBR|nr:hypothetical protein P3X46_028405 [Hevea brasiliensis]
MRRIKSEEINLFFDPEIEKTARNFRAESKKRKAKFKQLQEELANNNNNRSVKDHAYPNIGDFMPRITRPRVKANNFEPKPWLHFLPPGSITTWDELSQAFLAQYFAPSKTAKLRNELTSFKPRDDESLYEAWERSKDLQRRCPHHGIPKWMLVQHFYNGVSPAIRSTIDASSGGDLMEKSEDEAFSALDKIAYNNYQWSCERNEVKKPAGMFELDAMNMINAKFDALTRKMDKLSMKVDSSAGGSSNLVDVRAANVNCATDFSAFSQDFSSEQVDYVGNYNQRLGGNPFSTTYDPAWRNHPNFSWEVDKDNTKIFSNLLVDQMATHNKMLENQIAQQDSSSNSKAFGKLPSQPENTREQCNAVTLRSGKLMGEEHKIEKAQLDKQFGKFLEVLKKLYINIPFTDVISQMPSYAKFLREILSNKRRLEDYKTVALTEECSAILQNKLPPKLKDPESFSIPCHIRETSIERALCDLGASVSLMPLSICEKLKVEDLKPATISLQLADRSIKYPVGILENVPLKVGKFFIPVDFIVLEIEEDARMPIILGRPFLATAGANIDVKSGKLKMTVGEEEIEFNLFQYSKEPAMMNSCYRVDVIEHDAELKLLN